MSAAIGANHARQRWGYRRARSCSWPPEADSRVLGTDVRLAWVNHRFGVAAQCAERIGGGGSGGDLVVGAGCGDAHCAGAGLRRARGDVPGRGWDGTIPVLLAWAAGRVRGWLVIVAAGGLDRADRGAGRDHVREQPGLDTRELQHGLSERLEGGAAERVGPRRGGPRYGPVYRD
jgi:hypothetical protein